MAILLVPFTPEHLSSVVQFSERVWQRPKTEAYYRWRYLKCPTQIGILALKDSECLATLWAFSRPYQLDGKKIICFEALDWYCVPELRRSGLGIRLMHQLMSRPDPLIVVGGSSDTQAILPGLGWSNMGNVPSFSLPLQGAAITQYARERFGIPSPIGRSLFAVLGKPWFKPKPAIRQLNQETTHAPAFNLSILDLYSELPKDQLVPLPGPSFIDWLKQGRTFIGDYLILEFRQDKKLCGWSLSRFYPTSSGQEARIIELFSPQTDFYHWILGETLTEILAHNPDTVHMATGNPALQVALRQSKFIRHHESPAYFWPKDQTTVPTSAHFFGHNTSDAPFLPFHE